jgi:uncharacterized protein YndB with AHSA1/START domain
VGAAFGVALLYVYSGSPYAAMTSAFVYLAPVVVGATTAYFTEREARASLAHHAAASALANVLFVVGAMIVLLEGLICAVIILPLFVLLGMFGGLLMALVCRYTNWPTPMIVSVVLLPLVLGNTETEVALPNRQPTVERTITVRAPPDIVWRELLNTSSIQPEEVAQAWVYRIGVPLPLDGRMIEDAARPTRRVHMGKNVYFDEVIEELRPAERIRWTYRFYADSFPPYAFDEHVVIGGRYFDVLDTAYDLTPTAGGTTVRMTLRYRVSTRFNWYAAPVSRWLLGNLLDSNLNYYRQRSERAAAD